MAHEGMVHALEQCWNVLKPGGQLLDMRPISTGRILEIVGEGEAREAGIIDDSGGLPNDEAADRAIANLVTRGYFATGDSRKFYFANYWDTFDQMLRYVEERWNEFAFIPEPTMLEAGRLLAEAGSKPTRIRVRVPIRIVIYQRVEPAS